MPWQDRQKQGTFRGVRFEIQSNSLELGRRTAIYQIPGTELGVGHVDNGRRAWRQTMTVVVIGGDYDLGRDDLIEAFEEPGPGVLVHPYHGRKNVVIDGPVNISESSASGGLATFTFTAVEVARQETPEIKIDTRGALKAASAAANAAMNAAFAAQHKVSGFENFVRNSGIETIQDGLGKMRKITGAVGSVLAVPSRISAQIDDVTEQLVRLINAPADLVKAIEGVAISLADGIDQVRGAFGSYGDSASRAGDLDSEAASLDNADTPARRQQAANQRVAYFSMRGLLLSALAGATADAEFEFATDATDTRDALIAELDALTEDMSAADTTLETTVQDLGAAEDAATYQSLRDLEAALYDHLTAVAGEAKQVATYNPAESLPSVVIAYQLYGDASRAEEIETRNTATIRNPCFVPGGVDIEVLAE